MIRYDGTFVRIERPGATTPPMDGPGAIEIGDAVVLSGGRGRAWLANGVGCLAGAALVPFGIAIPFVTDALFDFDLMTVRKGPVLVAMICVALAMGGYGAGTWLVDTVLGPKKLVVKIPLGDLKGAEVQGNRVVLAWTVGSQTHLAFFVPSSVQPSVVAQALTR